MRKSSSQKNLFWRKKLMLLFGRIPYAHFVKTQTNKKKNILEED